MPLPILIISPPTFYKKNTREESGDKSDRKFVKETYK
jgi:hypothetical protein